MSTFSFFSKQQHPVSVSQNIAKSPDRRTDGRTDERTSLFKAPLTAKPGVFFEKNQIFQIIISLTPDRVWTSDRFLRTRTVYAHHVEVIRAKTNRS